MKRFAWLVLVAACAGKSSNATTMAQPPANTEAPPPATTTPPPADAPLDTKVCEGRADMFGPFQLDAMQAAARYGSGVRKVTEAPTPAKDRAIEVCGVGGERTWLGSVKCAGGETPKQLGRSGSVGGGGRCGAIIDKYQIECPEQTYDIFMDMYMCGPGESFL